MTLPPVQRNNPAQPYLTQLPDEVKPEIVKRVHDSIVEEAAVRNPSLSQEEAARATARSWANLNLVNKDLRNVAKQAKNDFPDIGTSVTRTALHKIARSNPNEFRATFVRLIEQNKHIEVPLSQLSVANQRIALEVLAQRSHQLETVKLDVSKHPNLPLPNLIQSINEMVSRNKDLNIGLDLSNNAIGDQGVKDLVNNLTKCKLSELNLGSTKITGESAETISEALSKFEITDLDLSYNLSADSDNQAKIALAIASKLEQSKLTSLNLSSCDIAKKGTKAIFDALSKSNLTHLNLAYCYCDTEGLTSLSEALPKSKLANLNLSSCRTNDNGAPIDDEDFRLKDEDVRLIAQKLKQSPQLKRLSLANTQITNQGVQYIAEKLKSSRLTHLDLSECENIDATGVQDLADNLEHSSLVSLILREVEMGDEGTKAIAEKMRHSKLIYLDLSSCQISEEGAQAIANNLEHSSLNSLILHGNEEIADDGAIAIAEKLGGSTLTHLDLSSCNTCPEGIKALARNLSQSSLTHLNLSCDFIGNNYEDDDLNPPGDEAPMAVLANALQDCKLNTLILSDTGLGDDDARVIADNLEASNLVNLNLSVNKIGDQGAIALASKLPQSKLAKLNLKRNPIEIRGQAMIANAQRQSNSLIVKRGN